MMNTVEKKNTQRAPELPMAGVVEAPSAEKTDVRKYHHTPADRAINYKAPRELYNVATWNPTLFDTLPEKDRAMWGGNSLDHLLKLYKLPPQARAIHTYFKGEIYKQTERIFRNEEAKRKKDAECKKEKPKKLTKSEKRELLNSVLPETPTFEFDTAPMYDMATGESYHKRGNGAKREKFNRQLVRWTGELSDAANIHILDTKETSGAHGHIYTKIICDAKRHKITIKMDRDYIINTVIDGHTYQQQVKAFSVAMGYNIGGASTQAHKVGTAMYNYIHDYWSDSRNREKRSLGMDVFLMFCGVPTLEDAVKDRHEARDVKEPIIDGIAIYRNAGAITYKWQLHGNEKNDEEARTAANKDFPNLRMVEFDFPKEQKRLPHKGNRGRTAKSAEPDAAPTSDNVPREV